MGIMDREYMRSPKDKKVRPRRRKKGASKEIMKASLMNRLRFALWRWLKRR